jgi:hypothetical protein
MAFTNPRVMRPDMCCRSQPRTTPQSTKGRFRTGLANLCDDLCMPKSFTGRSDTLQATRPELHCPHCSLWVCQCPIRCHTYLHISLEVAAFGHRDSSYCQAARSSLHCPCHGIRSHSQTSSLRGEVQVRVPVSRLPIVKFNALAKAFRRVFERAWFGNHSADALPGTACSWGCVTDSLSSIFA